jgi:hypothetical protein
MDVRVDCPDQQIVDAMFDGFCIIGNLHVSYPS